MILCFNQGNVNRCLVHRKLGIEPGLNCVNVLVTADKVRVRKEQKFYANCTKRLMQKGRQQNENGTELERAEDPDNPYCGVSTGTCQVSVILVGLCYHNFAVFQEMFILVSRKITK